MELIDTVVVSTRVRLARNFAAYPFPHRMRDRKIADTIISEVKEVLDGIDDFTLYRMDRLPVDTISSLRERHLISAALLSRPEISAVLLNSDDTVSVMVNEEDHLREQCLLSGYNIWTCYEVLSGIDDELSRISLLAFDEHFGYLTACPTNMGTGMRCSVMLFLPGLTWTNGIDALCEKIFHLGFVLRGEDGEGSYASGCLYQLSNEVTLGISEEKLLTEVNNVVLKIVQYEGEERRKLYASDRIALRDRVGRAYGILSNCSLLSYEEFLCLYTDLKLGLFLGILKGDIEGVNRLYFRMNDAALRRERKKGLSERELLAYRAEVLGMELELLIQKR
ncbi:MAG: ATP--guanido phosphotransferase [Clostridia bacterium]|nr:ATP--guanido phosphotransferase [Clostridia bacterium]